MGRKSFYEISSVDGYLREGAYLEVRQQINYRGDRADFKPFLNVPIKELEKQLKASQAAEKKVFEELKKAITAWDEHGAQTLLLQKAIEYLRAPEVTHTGNVWRQRKDGSWEISNLVYKMTFQIVKCGNEWKLAWELSYMAPGLSQGYWGYTRTPRERIEYEGSKKYKTLDGARKYIQSKFDQYGSYFESLSPPIPAEAKGLFCVNGQLLQAYSLMPPTPQKEKITLDDLLDCLEASDLAATAAQRDTTAQQEGAPPPTAAAAPEKQTPRQDQGQPPTPSRPSREPAPIRPIRPSLKKKPLRKKSMAAAR